MLSPGFYLGDMFELIKQVPDESVDLVVTDPPYGIDYVSNHYKLGNKFGKLVGDKVLDASYIQELYRVLKPNSAAYIFCRFDVVPPVKPFVVKNILTWVKSIGHGGLGDLKGSYKNNFEWCLFLVKGRHILNGGRDSAILHYPKNVIGGRIHPTQKPVEIMEYLITKSSNPGDLVLDPFAGAATTLLAAKSLGREYIGFETEAKYYNAGVKRLC